MYFRCLACKLGLLLLLILNSSTSSAEELRVAVASNFAPLLTQLAEQFQSQSNHKVVISAGATGRLYTQIQSGAPFDVFFAADDERPASLVEKKLAVANSLYTYALGQLLLWSPSLDLSTTAEVVLHAAQFRHLALANPNLAPYGAAAQAVMEHMSVWQSLQSKLVMGENIAQTLQFIASGNAELGFIAKAQWLALPIPQQGLPWQVPANLFPPIKQDAVILHDSVVARDFMAFMQSAAAHAAIIEAGYLLP